MAIPIPLKEGWDIIDRAITKVTRFIEGLSLTDLTAEDYILVHTTIYKMCTQKPPHNHSQQLYNKYKQAFVDYLTWKVLPSVRLKHDEFMLKELVKRWSCHKSMVVRVSHFFDYLAANFIACNSLPALDEIGLSTFHDLVYKEFKDKMIAAVISLIDRERKGERIDRALLKSGLDIFFEIGLETLECYENDYEAPILQNASTYYSQKTSRWISKCSFAKYMQKAEKCLKHEKDVVSHYLHSSSEPKLLEKVQIELLCTHASIVLDKENSGCHALLLDMKIDDLSRMYRLFSNITKGRELMSQLLKQHVITQGILLIKQAEDASYNKKVFVRKTIELDDKYLQYVSVCFQNDTLFKRAHREAMEVVFNNRFAGCSTTELLAIYCDHVLKKDGNYEAIDKIERVVQMLAYASDTDLFGRFYREKLAHRLLFCRSANHETERSALSILKGKCGDTFTSEMEGMVNDISLSRENQIKFEEHLMDNYHEVPGIDLMVTLLDTRSWPTYKSLNLNLPLDMVKCMETFNKFYEMNTRNRNLTWIESLGTCNIIGKFESKNIELIVTTSQAAVLVLFNDSDRLSLLEIMSQVNMSEGDARRVLYSLSCAKYNILNKEPNIQSPISSTDFFEFNSKFTHKKSQILISASLPPPPMDEKLMVTKLKEDRTYTIRSHLMQIMKRRKVLSQNMLIIECIEQLVRFKPTIEAMEKEIEVCIDQENLERDKNDARLIRYVA